MVKKAPRSRTFLWLSLILIVPVLCFSGYKLWFYITAGSDPDGLRMYPVGTMICDGDSYFVLNSFKAFHSLTVDGAQYYAGNEKQFVVAEIALCGMEYDDISCEKYTIASPAYSYSPDTYITALINGEQAPGEGQETIYRAVYICDDISTITSDIQQLGKTFFTIYINGYYFYVYEDEIYSQ